MTEYDMQFKLHSNPGHIYPIFVFSQNQKFWEQIEA